MLNFLMQHSDKKPVSFHMPGHKGSDIYRCFGYGDFLEGFMDMDVTEIPGADNLFCFDGIIGDLQREYANLYGARHSRLMINGTSGGILASILATVSPGEKTILGRNSHKAVFNGLRLAGGVPVYAAAETVHEYGIAGEITVGEIGRLIDENPEAKAVLITSPNYYGICSDIKGIAKLTHDAGMVLIVDQAHGAHLKFFEDYGSGEEMPASAEMQGADIVCNSTHKTLASMTQSAVLNICTDRIDMERLDDCLQVVESSSPSYILMTSLDINARLIRDNGEKLFREWKDNLDFFYDRAAAIPGLRVMTAPGMDITKLNIDMGMDGILLEDELCKRGVIPELTSGSIVMCMTGIGNKREDYEKLLTCLKDIQVQMSREETEAVAELAETIHPPYGEFISMPEGKEKVSLKEAAGRVSAGLVIPYPPGSPILCPGERIEEEMASYILKLVKAGRKVIGVDDKQCIYVGGHSK